MACKKVVSKIVNGAPNEILLVLDGTTGLNMLPQAREFNEVVGITGLILTKLDGLLEVAVWSVWLMSLVFL